MKKAIIIIGIVVAVASLLFELCVLKTYANKPAGEVPFWIFWLLSGN